MAELLLLNPRKRRRKHKAAKARKRRSYRRLRASRRRHVARVTRKARRRRALVVVGKSNPVRKRRRFRLRGYSRNPISSPMGFVNHTLIPSAVGAGGALGLDVLLGFASPYLPAAVASGPLRPVVRIAGAVALGMLATKVAGSKIGEQVAAGAITVTVYDVLKGLVKNVAPSLSLGEMDYASMGYYSPGLQVGSEEFPGMSEYVDGMGQYVD